MGVVAHGGPKGVGGVALVGDHALVGGVGDLAQALNRISKKSKMFGRGAYML